MNIFPYLYARLVVRKRITMDEVPPCFKEEVVKILEEQEKDNKDKREVM